jgi:hypothetical protein
MHPKSSDAKVFVFSDRIELEDPKLRIVYNSIRNIENADEKKISALRVVGLGLLFLPLAIVGAVWKKKHIYTIVEYTNALNEEQTLVFDLGGKVEEAQQMMYNGMHAIKQQSPRPELAEHNAVTTMSKPHEINSSDDDPLRILQIRFAKGEIAVRPGEYWPNIFSSCCCSDSFSVK